MTDLEFKILALMKGENPPQTVKALLEACQPVAKATVFSKISILLSAGELTRDDLPWRKDKESRTKAGRPKDKKLKNLEKTVEDWIKEGEKDRVSAGKLLLELRQAGSEILGPPPPDDKPSTIKALMQQMAAVGREWTMEALNEVFPPHDILLTQEAAVGKGSDVGTATPS